MRRWRGLILYFLDYAIFTGAIRHYAAKTLEEAFKQDPNPQRRRLHFVNLLREEYAGYEDTGALLDAFLDYREGRLDHPIASLMTFRPAEVALAAMFESHQISSGDELYRRLRLGEWIPREWSEWFPDLDLPKSLALACRFFFEDCARNQKPYGVIAYNKIKHGLLIVPSGRAYKGGDYPDTPAALLPTPGERQKEGAPAYSIYGFPCDDVHIEQRHASIEFIQCNLRLLSGLYVTWRYPAVLAGKGISPRQLFACKEFYDVRHLISEVTQKK